VTNTDNPNGWIEPTTYCQLKCPGCYRGLDTGDVIFTHIDLETMKRQVDGFVEKRNIQTISIAGGEPLMYPQIGELVRYVKSRGLFTKIYSNGLALTEPKLRALREDGLTEIVIHIDMFQDLPGYEGKNESELNPLRQKYVDLVKAVGGVNLGFIMPISAGNLPYLGDVLRFYRKNIDEINLVVFTTLKDPNGNDGTAITCEYLAEQIAKHTPYAPSSYLPKVKDESRASWLFSMGFGNPDGYFGDVDAGFYRGLVERYYKKWNKYFITRKKKKIPMLNLLPAMFNASCFRILKNAFFAKNKDLHYQVILIIDPPDRVGDWCDACPDIMYVGDKHYPSCMVNQLKEFKSKFLRK
jgi:hypothetical protein